MKSRQPQPIRILYVSAIALLVCIFWIFGIVRSAHTFTEFSVPIGGTYNELFSYSADKEEIATCDERGQLVVYRLRDRLLHQTRRIPLPHAKLRNLWTSPNQRYIAASYSNNTVRLWDTRTWSYRPFFLNNSSNIAFSEQGDLTVIDGKELDVFETNTGKKRTVLDRGRGRKIPLEVFQNSQVASLNHKGNLCLWSLHTLALQCCIPANRFQGELVTWAFSPDGKLLACTTTQRRIYLIDTRTGQILRDWKTPEDIYHGSIAFSPNGQCLAAPLYRGQIALIHLTDKGLLDTLHSPSSIGAILFAPEPISDLRFAPDSQFLVSNGKNGTGVCLWNVTAKRLLAETHHIFSLRAVQFSSHRVHLIDVVNNVEQYQHIQPGWCVNVVDFRY